MMMRTRIGLGFIVGAVAYGGVVAWPVVSARQQGRGAPASAAVEGRTTTVLADGRLLLLGGQGSSGVLGTAAIVDPRSGATTPLPGSLAVPRADHTATLLADGTVLIVGGHRALGQLAEVAELFDPDTGTFLPFGVSGSTARAGHTATVLTDGRVMIAGGTTSGERPAAEIEVWDLPGQRMSTLSEVIHDARVGHTATLLPDGRVSLSGGMDATGHQIGHSEIIDVARQRVTVAEPASDNGPVRISEAVPVNGATDVSLDGHLAVRFSQELAVGTIASETVMLTGPDGAVSTKLVAAEHGRLVFVWPTTPLAEGTTYVLRVSGATSVAGVPVAPASIAFTTSMPTRSPADAADAEDWRPDGDSIKAGWRTGRPASPWELLSPLQGPSGATAVSGRVLTLDGRPLRGVTLAIEGEGATQSDRTGRFLLALTPGVTGRRVLQIEGRTASHPGRTYGFFEYGMTVVGSETNILPFTIWMPKLDEAHAVTIPSPTTNEVVVTTPYIAGLELHIPPGAVIVGEDGKPVKRVSITPIPVDRPPFPLAKNVVVPVYFTVQPGGAYVQTSGNGLKGAQLVYPNYRNDPAGQRLQFYHYDPDENDWYVYGMGTVTASATQVKPDPTTRFYKFTGAMINDGTPTPPGGKTPGGLPLGDPVDPSTGVFVMSKTDLYLPDVIPLSLTRTYNSGDGYARPVGRSMTHQYAMFLHSEQQYQQADLILPEGGKIHFVRTSAGTGYSDAIFVHQETATTSATPTAFYKSVIAWNGNGWNLTLKDGTVYVFGDVAPLQAIRDRNGNTVTITHATGQTGNITQVTSPNGRWITFTYDASNRVTQAKDNIGRTVNYTYDANGNLSTVTDPENGVTTYAYDASNRMVTIKDARGTVYLTNQYQNGRISTQTLVDPSATYQFAYTVDGSGKITQTDITDPRGHIRRQTFNADHYLVTDIEALGTSEERTTTMERQTGSNLVTAVTDGLGRRIEFTYDANGHVLTTTRLAGTGNAVTTTFTYEPQFSQIVTITDPLNHTWTMGYDALGHMTSATDPLSHQATLAWTAQGQVASITDALQHTSQLSYSGADLTSITNPLSAVSRQFVDAAGRVVSVTDALGRQTRLLPDKLNRVTGVIDTLGGQTSFAYDSNGNLLTLTDALAHSMSYGYDANDRVATRTDALQNVASYQYDKNNNLTQSTDRKGQISSYQYDALDRLTRTTYADASTIDYTYDLGDRVTQIVDSLNGTITRAYDGLDRLTSEVSPNGTVSYTYDAANRRSTSTVAGQSAVAYGYDAANRLTSITQGANVVSLTYDNANRRSTLTFPNAVVATYGYDAANHLTSLAYTRNGTSVGDLTYTYDAAGRRMVVGGSFARTGLPQALASSTYDLGNRVASWNGQAFSYDPNGNLTSDGLTSYTWNARNQLASVSWGTSASFAYDGLGRRRGKTIGGSTTNFLYDGLNLIQELSGSTPTANLLTGWGIDEIVTRMDSSGTSTFLIDALGSPLALADASGTVQTQYTFEPFGTTTASGAASANAAQFTGRENDGTGLYYYRARYYHPQLQRFIREDPLGFDAGDVNLYAYVGNEPTRLTDPTGLVAFLPPPSCRPPGRKDPPLSWWLRCSPIVVPDLIPPIPFPWWPSPPTTPPREPPTFPGWDPTEPPPGFPEWRGPDAPGGPRGGYNGPGGSMSPDLGHGPPIGPHWDWVDPVTGAPWRVYPPLPPGMVPK